MTAAAEIVAEGIGKDFGRFTALRDISLTIGRGEFLTLLGPSGSGKTTFLMILAGFELPTAGRLRLDGRDVTREAAETRGFGMVFQGYALFPHMTVRQNVAFPLQVQRRANVQRRAEEVIAMVGLSAHADKRPAALSGGQQQRVALARALACEPPVILMDEPFSALDKHLRGQMQDELRSLQARTGTTLVFVTHDQSEALALSSRVAIFDHGALQQVGAPQEVYDRPASRFVATFLGDINLVPAAEAGAGTRAGALLGIRPEHMTLTDARPDGPAVAVSLVALTYQGAQTRLSLVTDAGTAVTVLRPTADLPAALGPGVRFWAGWPSARAVPLNDD